MNGGADFGKNAPFVGSMRHQLVPCCLQSDLVGQLDLDGCAESLGGRVAAVGARSLIDAWGRICPRSSRNVRSIHCTLIMVKSVANEYAKG